MSRSTALESHMYGDPMEVYAAKQAREKRKAENPAPKRPILTLKSRKSDGEWSEARKAAESLFAPEPVRASSPATPRNTGHAGGIGKDLHD